MQDVNQLKNYLEIVIDNIHKQFITLQRIDFKKDESIVDIQREELENIEHKFGIGMSTGEVKDDKRGGVFPSINIAYKLEEKIYVKKKKEPAFTMIIEYMLYIILRAEEKVYEVLKNEEVIEKYAEGTGLLTVYPYIRHMADVLHKEARIYIPPYPPMKAKPIK